jgi:hypothetical protein
MKWRLRRGDRPRRSGLEKDGSELDKHLSPTWKNLVLQKKKEEKKEFAYLPTHTQKSWVGFGQTEIFLRMALYSFFSFFSTNLSLNLKLNGLFSQKIHLIITDWPTWIVSPTSDIKHTLIYATMKSIMQLSPLWGWKWMWQDKSKFD